MRRRHIASVIVLLAAAIVAASAQSKPNFSGTWIMVAPPSGDADPETIVHNEKTISFTHPSSAGEHDFSYRLDGTETGNVIKMHNEEITTKARVTWEGSTLVIVEAATYPDGRKSEMRRTLTLNADGLLEQTLSGTRDGKPQPERKSTWKRKGADSRQPTAVGC